MTDTPRLAMGEMASDQDSKHVTFNEALAILDVLVHLSAKSRTQTAPPVSPAPSEGDTYIIPVGATDDWADFDVDDIAIYRDNLWTPITPRRGFRAYIEDESSISPDAGFVVVYSGQAWGPYQVDAVLTSGSVANSHLANMVQATIKGRASGAGTGAPTDLTAAQVGTIISLDLKAPLASPTLTGTPAAPTAAPGTNTTQIATTAFVKALGDLKQPLHANLTEFAALSAFLNGLPYFTGFGSAMALGTITEYGRSLVDDADAAAARTTLGLGSIATQAASAVAITGGTVAGITDLAVSDGGTGSSTAAGARTNLAAQAQHNHLIELAGLVAAANSLPYFASLAGDGTGVMALATLTSFARTLLDDTSAADARTTLAAAPTASPSFTGTASFGGVITASAGSAGAPGIAFASDLDTGMWSPAADTIAFSSQGVEVVRIVPTGAGKLLVGHTASIAVSAIDGAIQAHGNSASAGSAVTRWTANSSGPVMLLGKSRAATIGTFTVVQASDIFGEIRFCGDDGTDMASIGASIRAVVDGTPGTADMPGRLEFRTTADGAASGTLRQTIDSTGLIFATASYRAHSGTAIPAGGTAGAGYLLSSTANFGVFFGSGAPTLSAAKGSSYLRSDGSSTSTRAYINTDGGTTWTAVTTAA